MSEEAVQAAEAAEDAPVAAEEVQEAVAEAVAEPEASVEAASAPAMVAEPEAPATVAETVEAPVETEPVRPEDVSYQAVEKEGTVTAIWEMQGQKHLRTIDPRSIEGKQILALFETAG